MRLIDADELREYWLYNGLNEKIYDTNDVLESIDEQPTINPETQRPIGTWIVTKTNICGVNRYECPFCGATRFRASAFRLNYCNNCGAKLGV